jgi:hypothetical protein
LIGLTVRRAVIRRQVGTAAEHFIVVERPGQLIKSFGLFVERKL